MEACCGGKGGIGPDKTISETDRRAGEDPRLSVDNAPHQDDRQRQFWVGWALPIACRVSGS